MSKKNVTNNAKDTFIRDVTKVHPLSKDVVRVRLETLLEEEREKGKQEQAELDRALYGTSVEDYKEGKLNLEEIKAKEREKVVEEIIDVLNKLIEERDE